MVHNQQELRQAARTWVNHAQNDMKRQLQSFMRNVGTNVAELARALDTTPAELQGVLDGRLIPSVELFAKILIATDHMLEIKPVGATPFGGRHASMPCASSPFSRMEPSRRFRASQPADEGGNPADEGGNPAGPQPRDAHGRFMPRKKKTGYPLPEDVMAGAPQMGVACIDFNTMSRGDLIDFIEEQGWDDELEGDIDDMSRRELAAFAVRHADNAENMQRVEGGEPVVDDEVDDELDFIDDDAQEENEVEDEDGELGNIIATAIRQNPELKNAIKRFLD